MSLEAVAWSLRQDVGDPIAKLILISLADHHNISTGECFPSKARLCEACCRDERTVKRKIADMVEQGWISVKPRFAENGRQTSNAYEIKFDRKTAEKPGVHQCPPPPSLGGHSSVPLVGGTCCPPHSLTVKGTKEARAPAKDASESTRTVALSAPGSPIAGGKETGAFGKADSDAVRIERNATKAAAEDDAAHAARVAILNGLSRDLHAGSHGKPPPRCSVKTSRPMEIAR